MQSSTRNVRWPSLLILVLLGITAALRVGTALKPGLWADEIFSLAMATGHSLEHPAHLAEPALGDFVETPEPQPPAYFRRYTEHAAQPAGPQRVLRAVFLSDTNPPLYYLLLNGWTRVTGTSDAALRLFSALWGLLSLPLLWLVGRTVAGPRTAWIATALFAFAPPAIYYSAEGRMYSLTWFLGLALAWATLELSRRGSRPIWLLLWIVAGVAGLLTHYFFAFVWLACLVWLLWDPGRLRRLHIALAALLVLLLIVPWYAQIPASLAAWRVTGGWLAQPLSPAQIVSAPVKLAANLVSGRGVWGGSRWFDRFLALAYVGLIVVALRRDLRPLFAGPRLLPWLWVGAAVLGPVAFDVLRGTNASLIARYALPGLPAAMLLLASAIGRLSPRLQPPYALLLVLLWMPGTVDTLISPERHWRPYPTIAAQLESAAEPGDVAIVHSIPSGVIAVARYLERPVPLASWVVQLGQREAPGSIETILEDHCRAVLVKVHHLDEPSPAEAWLTANAVLEAADSIVIDDRWVISETMYFRPRSTAGTHVTRCPASRRPETSAPDTPPPAARRSGA